MQFASLPPILVAIAQQRALNAVLATIVDVVAAQPDVALARLWLRQTDADCPVCPGTARVDGESLHLRASHGFPLQPGSDWSRSDGSFHRVPLNRGELKISHIASSGDALRIQNLTAAPAWIRYPAWARSEQLVGFAGHPIVFRGEVLGVLAVFRRTEPDDQCWEWLRTLADAAAVAIANALAFEQVEALRRELEQERDYLCREVRELGSFGEILGSTEPLQRILRQIELVAPTDANVLIQGESGSGKELVARALHDRSGRSRKPLVKVNCGSIPRELFESEFFGQAKGSFTGAVQDRIGRVQLADGGTLFLDEIGEIPLELQSKLLRVLRKGEFERVGDETIRRVDVRVVAATNRDLKHEIREGRFRLDLYYGLGVFPLDVPSLRERREDIPVLAAHFVRRACMRFHVSPPRLTQRELDRASNYDWPGNVRELQNIVERAVILAQGGALVFDLPVHAALPPVRAGDPTEVIPEFEWREMEKRNLESALLAAKHKISGPGGAAELLGLNPATLTSRLKAHGILR